MGECLIYTNVANRLNYLIGSEVQTVAHFDKSMYLPAHIRMYLTDKGMQVYDYALSLMFEFQSAILRGELDTAAEILPSIPKEQHNKITCSLEVQGT